jgi:hypothetical protein
MADDATPKAPPAKKSLPSELIMSARCSAEINQCVRPPQRSARVLGVFARGVSGLLTRTFDFRTGPLGHVIGARRPQFGRGRVNRTGRVARAEPRPDGALGHHLFWGRHGRRHGRRAVERGDVRGRAGEVINWLYVRLMTRRRRPLGGHTLRNNALARAYGAPGDLGAG